MSTLYIPVCSDTPLLMCFMHVWECACSSGLVLEYQKHWMDSPEFELVMQSAQQWKGFAPIIERILCWLPKSLPGHHRNTCHLRRDVTSWIVSYLLLEQQKNHGTRHELCCYLLARHHHIQKLCPFHIFCLFEDSSVKASSVAFVVTGTFCLLPCILHHLQMISILFVVAEFFSTYSTINSLSGIWLHTGTLTL